ncbi:MAG TPA: O-antigen ligase family protein [Thermoflexia bacterium]|nr:O-antigen ligase family protein [Thermoflexia bacterium]
MRAWVRLFLWMALLLAVGLVAQNVVVTHQTRTRGLPDGFPAPVAEAAVPILGINVALEQYDKAELDAVLTRIAAGGFVWVRQSFYVGARLPRPYDWTASDRIMDALARHPQLQLVAVLDDSPPVPPADPERFAAFAYEFAARYGAQVDYYQIWDEPNLADHWGGGPVNPPAYADLLARAAIAIRTADPDARILLAGLAPTTETGPQNLSDVRYLEQLYQAGAAPYFDIVAGKPYGFDTAPADRRADEGVLNFSRLLLLREVMVEHGDAGKPVWASHWGWNALPGDWTGAPSLWGQTDEATQAARTVAALERARVEWPWAGAMMLEHLQPAVPLDDPRWGFALLSPAGDPRPLYDAISAWAATLPDAAPPGGYPARNPWAVYEGDWRVGPLGADVGSGVCRAAFRFEGTRVALTVRRGPYRAFLYVTVDGEPANALPRDEMGRAYVVLYDSAPSVATVPLATGLSPGPHAVRLMAERGQGQWVLVNWRVGAEPVRDGFIWWMTWLIAAGLALVALLVRDARRVEWSALAQRFLAWPEWAQVTLVAGWSGLLWITAGVSWGHDWGSPWLVVSVPVLLALVCLLALRLDLGLALVAFTAPFYLRPGDMFYRALSMPELLVILCGLAYLHTRKLACLHTSPLDWAVLLLLAAAGAAGVAAADKIAALFELRTVFLFPALYYALLRLARLDDRARRRLVDGFVLGAVGVALIGLAQYALGRNVVIAEGELVRLQSVYYSPNGVGLYLGRVWPLLLAVVILPSSAACSTVARRDRRRVFYGLALPVVTLALGLSFSRGALLLGLPASLLVMGWRAGGRYRRAALVIVLIGALALIPLLCVPRFASLLDWQRGSTFFRLELWRSSLSLIRERPWFGVGPGNFVKAYRTRYVLPSAWQEFNLEHPHNVYLDHWTRMGLLGLLAGIVVQVAFFKSQIPNPSAPAEQETKSPIFIGLTGSMVALLAHGLVDNTLFFPDLALVFFMMLALAYPTDYYPSHSHYGD